MMYTGAKVPDLDRLSDRERIKAVERWMRETNTLIRREFMNMEKELRKIGNEEEN